MRQHREMAIDGSPREERRGRGQPPIFEAAMTRTFLIRMTEDQYRDLTDIAAAEGKGRSTLIREFVDECIGDYREKRMFFLNRKRYLPE
jgi:hypothetical protein